MKIFKIKFDSKDPTDRSISVKKGDDFGIAIQIDNQLTQGPATITYGGQTISADTELVAGYNTFLLKGLADEKISVKDIDSQVIFTVNILAKDSDVVELGGTGGGGGDSVWQANDADYYIDGALSVNNCQKVTITGNNDQVILKGNDNNASYEIVCGDLKLNTAYSIRIHPTGGTVPRIALDGTSPYIAFDCTYLNLTYDSGGCNNNAININGCGICVDAQQGNLQLKSGNNLNICAGSQACVTAGNVVIDGNSQVAIYSNGHKAIDIYECGGVNKILFYSPDGSLKTDVKDIILSASRNTNISSDNVNITSRDTISANGQAVKLETLSSQSYIMVGLPGCGSSYAGKYIGIKSDQIETCAGEYYSTYVCGQPVIDSTYRFDAKINQFGNCNMATQMYATKFGLYTTGAGSIMDSDYETVTFSNTYNTTTLAGNKITLSTEATCGAGIITFAPQPCGGNSTILQLSSSYCDSANDYNVKFILPTNLEFYGMSDCNTNPQEYYARSKVFLTLLSALETTYHNECANDDTNYNASAVDTIVYNKLTSIFATK